MTEHTPQGKHETYYPQKEGVLTVFLNIACHIRVDRELSSTLTVMKWVKKENWYLKIFLQPE